MPTALPILHAAPIFANKDYREVLRREMDGLKLKRKDVETTIEATIQTLRNTLEFVREQDTREREEKILYHRPRLADIESRAV